MHEAAQHLHVIGAARRSPELVRIDRITSVIGDAGEMLRDEIMAGIDTQPIIAIGAIGVGHVTAVIDENDHVNSLPSRVVSVSPADSPHYEKQFQEYPLNNSLKYRNFKHLNQVDVILNLPHGT